MVEGSRLFGSSPPRPRFWPLKAVKLLISANWFWDWEMIIIDADVSSMVFFSRLLNRVT